MKTFDRITSDPARLGGELRIRNSRLRVRRVIEAAALYPDREELKREYPEREDDNIHLALDYAAACLEDQGSFKPN